jgi:hypothetical protein
MQEFRKAKSYILALLPFNCGVSQGYAASNGIGDYIYLVKENWGGFWNKEELPHQLKESGLFSVHVDQEAKVALVIFEKYVTISTNLSGTANTTHYFLK